MENKREKLGQYFTECDVLKEKLFSFILNKPRRILEPSVGRGDLVEYVSERLDSHFDMYEIDKDIPVLSSIDKEKINYCDFLEQNISKRYKTIIGNPPYVKSRGKNLYVRFIEKCYDLLSYNGELIFIVPSAVFGLTSSAKLLNEMMENGTVTHIYHPNNERLFEGASIDIVIFRYCKNNSLDRLVNYNGETLTLMNNHGLVTFSKDKSEDTYPLGDYFDIHVGLVNGREEIYKNDELGNIEVLNDENQIKKYIYIIHFPSESEEINNYLLEHKDELINRRIRKFNENNWFVWGAMRNMKVMEEHKGEQCIYLRNLTRKEKVAFLGEVRYFGGKLIMLRPKTECNISGVMEFLNSEEFRKKFIFSGRFKIGQRQLVVSHIPKKYL
jgi:adenine-specific DNA-methyltransferase